MKLPKLERYNQVVWAVVGTGVVGAVVLGMLVVAAIIVRSLFDDIGGLPVDVVEMNGPEDARRETAEYDFCLPVDVHGSPYQLIRVASDKLVVRNVMVARSGKAKGYGSGGSFSGYSPDQETCGDNTRGVVNVLVRNADNGDMHLALAENAVIFTLDYPTEHTTTYSDDFPPVGVLFWEIAFADSNNDGVIDELDDLGAYLSDIDGRDLKRITPSMSRVLSKTYDGDRNLLLLRVLRDTNSDGKLDNDDHASLVESSVTTRTLVREILDKETLAAVMRAAEPNRNVPAATGGRMEK